VDEQLKILQSLNSKGVTPVRRVAFPDEGVIRNRETDLVYSAVIVCARGCVNGANRSRPTGPAQCHTQQQPGRANPRFPRRRTFARERLIADWAAILELPSEPGIGDFVVREEVETCVAMARSTETLLAAGDRLAAARAAVELVRAYDRVLEKIRLVPLSLMEQRRLRDRLAPVAELLRKYRFR
jgi:hypothetical protein